MKQIGLLLLTLIIATNVFSQAAVAKIKYEEAEEAFVANDFAGTLAKLDEVETLLKQTNPRTLYLRITAQNELRKTQGAVDLQLIRSLKKNCQDYLVKYESVEGIEEKYKSVYKILESLKLFYTADKAFANIGKGLPADMDTIAMAYYRVKNYGTAMEWHTKAAALNDAYALMRLGFMYCYAEGVKENNAKAIEYFEKAAALNESTAMFYLGYAHLHGWGIPVDSAKGYEWIEKSYRTALPLAEKGNAAQQYRTGIALANVKNPDWQAVQGWYQKAADKGFPAALSSLASWYMNGSHVEKNADKALDLYKTVAAGGDAAAMYAIAYQYYMGKNVMKDYSKAYEWFKKGAEHGDGASAFYIGYMYANGEGLTKDAAQAAVWYQLGAARKNRSSINNLGVLYENGNGVPKNEAKALACYEQAAELGNEYSMNNLGNIYKNGLLGQSVNYAKAAEWYKKAALAEKTDAMFNYAKMLEDGQGVTKDYTAAIEWYTKAANKGYKDAFDRLYSIYYNGLGVKKDKKLASEWLRKKYAATN